MKLFKSVKMPLDVRTLKSIPGVGAVGADDNGDIYVQTVDPSTVSGEVPVVAVDLGELIRLAREQHLDALAIAEATALYLDASAKGAALWKEIEALGWAKKLDYKDASRKLAKNPSRKEIENFGYACRAHLYDMVSRCDVDIPLGSDGTNDLLCHIVGLGRAEYEAALKDPNKVLVSHADGEYGTAEGYKENFFYSFQQ